MTYFPDVTTLAAFGFGLITVRVGAALVVLPFFGSQYVSAPIRVAFAILISILIYPSMAGNFPPIPKTGLGIGLIFLSEAAIGAFFGFIARFLISTMHIVGSIISTQSSLASATLFDPNQGAQNSLEGNFLSLVAMTLLLTLDMHHLMLSALVQSYDVISPEGSFPMQDMSMAIIQLMNHIFLIAFKLASPNIVVNLLLFIGGGILSRLMPAMQIFFVILPGQIMIAFIVLMLTFGTAMNWYANVVSETLQHWNFETRH